MLDAKLPHLDGWNAARAPPRPALPRTARRRAGPDAARAARPEGHVWHLYVVLVHGRDRDELRRRSADRGVATGVHYPTPVPFQPAYAHLGYRPRRLPGRRGPVRQLPVAADVSRR